MLWRPRVEIVRVEDDLERAVDAIRRSELPDDLPSTDSMPAQVAADNV